MRKILLALALIPTLIACTNGAESTTKNEVQEETQEEVEKEIKMELLQNETLFVYSEDFSDTYRLNGYSTIHGLGNTLELTKISYTYWNDSNALDVETNLCVIKYRGFSTNFNIVTIYGN